MKTNNGMRTVAFSATRMLLFSGVFLATDAFAQDRGRSVRMPNTSTAFRAGGGAPFASHSGGQGLKNLGSQFGYGGGGCYGHGSHNDHYSNAEAYRDVGIANAAVGLVGAVVGAYSYPAYPAVVASPVVYPAPVISSPGVIVGSYPYGYAPCAYPYGGYGYGASYYAPYSYPYSGYGYATSYYAPYPYAYGGYGYGRSYCNPPAMGHYPDQHGSPYYGGNHGQPGSWQNGRGGAQTPTHQGPGMQAPRSSYRGGNAPGMQAPRSAYRGGASSSMQAPRSVYRGGAAPSLSVSRGGGRSPQQSGMRPSGQSHRMR